RRELAVASVMNLLGPLANPAGVRRQVVGVADADRAPLMAGALARLGVEHALVVHGRVGMDEIAPQGITDVWEVRSGTVTRWEIDPADHGLAVDDLTGLAGAEPPANAARIERLLGDGLEPDPPAGFPIEALDRGARAVHQRDHRLAVVGLVALVDHDEVAVFDVLVDHRLTAYLQDVAPATAGNQLVGHRDRVRAAHRFDGC